MSDKCFKNTTINTAYYLTVSIPVYFNITFYWCENLAIWQKRTEIFQCAFAIKIFDSEIKSSGVNPENLSGNIWFSECPCWATFAVRF